MLKDQTYYETRARVMATARAAYQTRLLAQYAPNPNELSPEALAALKEMVISHRMREVRAARSERQRIAREIRERETRIARLTAELAELAESETADQADER